MSRFAAIIIVLGLLVSGGCFTTGPKDVPAPPPVPKASGPPAVSADQITPQNARAKCQELEEEMNREEQTLLSGVALN